MPRAVDGYTLDQAKAGVLDAIAKGLSVEEACKKVSRSRKSYENWRSADPEWARKVDSARARRARARERGKDPELYNLGFAEWRKRFLRQDTYPHQQMWIDVLEGRDPDVWHPAITYRKKDPRRILVNTPPFHPAHVETPILTKRGWTTIGDVSEDDWIVGSDGAWWPVLKTWSSPGEVPLYEVHFETGDVVRTDANHIWQVTKTYTGKTAELTTAAIAADLRWGSGVSKWKVPVAPPVRGDHADLPLDPYLLGYWLGDGSRSSSVISVGKEDIEDLKSHVGSLGLTYHVRPDSRGGNALTLYVHGIRKLLPLGSKRIPAALFTASAEQRLALLQGLMDSDGSINPKDGRAYFGQTDDGLALDAYRLICSLGFKASLRREKQNPTAPNGVPSGPLTNRVYFKPNGTPVFRLERKLRHQKVTTSRCKTGFRTIRDVKQVGMGPVKCISVRAPADLFAIGDGLILNHNAKSQTITQEYVTYYLCMNPARRVVIISETSEAAKKFLYSIQTMLTSPDFVELQEAYAPEGGFKPARGEGRWGSNQIYLAGRAEGAVDQAAKDPSVQIVGVGGQIYGSRADLIILDDAVSDKNAAGYEKQFGWLTRTVLSRAKSGKVLVVGTRVAPIDLYATMLNGDNYTTGESPWTYVAQPAVLEYGDTPAEWRTLWPRSSRPMDEVLEQEPGEDGLYQCWDGEELARVRADNPPGVWALVYQQQQVDDDMTFSSMCVWGSVDRRRKPGPLKAGAWGHPYNGLEGMRNILSIDPAGTGEAFMLAYSVDRVKGQRWVQNAWTSNHTKPSWYADMIEKICPEYEIHDVVIESNAYASWLIHDERIVNYCRQRGIRISGHYTSKNKTDPDFGVASMSSLFGSVARRDDGRGNETGAEHHKGDNIIFLPDPDKSAGVKALIDQLITWVPGRRGGHLRQDGPMALWFAELRARTYLQGGDKPPQTHVKNRFLSPRAARQRIVVPMHMGV